MKKKKSLRVEFIAFDDKLARLGVPPLTAWWRDGIGRWLDAYESGHVLELWACVGRGAAKSTALYKICMFFALFGGFAVPVGEVHYAIVLSRLKEEASKGIVIIAGWLRLLGIEHRLAGDVIELVHLPRGIRVVAASVAATSGWRAFFTGRDERSKWGYDGSENVDADEVDTSATAMTATHPFAPSVTTGSAWGRFGSFYDAIVGGTDASRVVLGPAPTWVAAPHITEADTRRKERDPRRWAREYACEFSAAESAAFDPVQIEAAERAEVDPDAPQGEPIVIIDASSGGKDAFAWCTARRVRLASGIDGVRFDNIDSADTRRIPTDAIVCRIARLAQDVGARSVHGDQRDAHALQSMFRQLGIQFREQTWTNVTKPEAVEIVRRWFRDAAISLPVHEQLHRELLMFQERLTSLGQFTFSGRRDDHVALLLTCALAAENSGLPRIPLIGGPRSRPRTKTAASPFGAYHSPFNESETGSGRDGFVSSGVLNVLRSHRMTRNSGF